MLNTNMDLVCSTCKELKDSSEFSKKNKSKRGFSYKCKKCHNEYSKNKWYPENQQQQILASNTWKQKNKLRVKATRYGIDFKKAEDLLELADGKCQICKKECDLCLDHCHIGGHVRGFLCSTCNAGLGMFRDDISLFEHAIEYLKNQKGEWPSG